MLPEKMENPEPWFKNNGASEEVLVKVEGFKEFFLGRYLHEVGIWKVNGFGGKEPVVTEWWQLPTEPGNIVKQKPEKDLSWDKFSDIRR